jgi:hypothetical protein
VNALEARVLHVLRADGADPGLVAECLHRLAALYSAKGRHDRAVAILRVVDDVVCSGERT